VKVIKRILTLLLLISCNSNVDKTNEITVNASPVTDTSYVVFPKQDLAHEIVTVRGYYVWEVNASKKTLKKNPVLGNAAVDIDSIIYGLNQQYKNIFLEKTALTNDTLYLKIAHAGYLTNQMGSSGPGQYLAQAVINFTAAPTVKYVQFSFKEGEHAAPGTWSRKDFPGYIIIQ
jgi:hypothetical protein